MTERDAFESRLRAALLRHVAEGPTDFDALGFARTVAAKEPRRHGFATALSWRGLAIPRLAWLLLLAGPLLAALVGGALLVGAQMQRKLPAVVPNLGPVATCPPGSTPDEPGPVGQARPLVSGYPQMAFDRRAGRLIALPGIIPETWTFDVCTNTWTEMRPTREPTGLQHSDLVYDVDSDVTIVESAGKVWAYDLQANTWTEKGPAKGAPLFYDPVSGLVVAGSFESTALWSYDVETDTWTPIYHANGPRSGGVGWAGSGGAWRVFAYDASVDRVVVDAFDGHEPWLLDIRTGTWSRSGVEALVFIEGFWSVPAVAYDETAERTVFVGSVRWAAYDAAADSWEFLGERSGEERSSPMVYDAVNRRLVNIEDGGRVVAFDLVTRAWTVLLEPSEAQPTP